MNPLANIQFLFIISITYLCVLFFHSYTVDDRPKEIYLGRHIRPQLCAACDVNTQLWKDLGRELMPDAETELSTISVQHRSNVVDCCSSLFQLWLQRKSNASWKELLDALKKVNQNYLATQIEGMLVPSVDIATEIEKSVPVVPVEGNYLYKGLIMHVYALMTRSYNFVRTYSTYVCRCCNNYSHTINFSSMYANSKKLLMYDRHYRGTYVCDPSRSPAHIKKHNNYIYTRTIMCT